MNFDQLHLSNLKPGDEITTITLKGKRKVYGAIRVITEYDERWKALRYAKPSDLTKNVGRVPADGKGYYFMQNRDTPPAYYYTANPLHLKAARAQHAKMFAALAKKEAEQARRMALALPIGDLLKTEYYDREECYRLDSTRDIAEELVKRLTDEQIITLRNWLKL